MTQLKTLLVLSPLLMVLLRRLWLNIPAINRFLEIELGPQHTYLTWLPLRLRKTWLRLTNLGSVIGAILTYLHSHPDTYGRWEDRCK